jgi:PAS domain S-box-containing protein
VFQDYTLPAVVNTEMESDEGRYRWLMENAHDGIVVVDLEGNYLDVNAKMCQMSGYTRDELLHINVDHLVSASEKAMVQQRLAEVRAGQRVLDERHLLRKDGSLLPIEVSGQMLDNQTMQAIFRDVSERRAESALRESEQKYRHLFEYANDGILVIDTDTGRIVDLNRHIVKQLGYTREELLMMKVGDIEMPADQYQIQPVRNELVSKGTLVFEQVYRRKDGSPLFAETSSRIVQSGGKNLLLSFVRDIAKRKEIEAKEREQRAITEALRDTAADLSSTLHFHEVVQRILEHVMQVIPCDTANFAVVEDGVVRVIAQNGYEKRGLAEEVLSVQFPLEAVENLRWIVEHQSPYVISDTETYHAWVNIPSTAWIGSHVAVPVQAGDRVIGLINLDSVKKRAFTADHVATLQAFAHQASIAVQNARLYDAVQNYAAELEERVIQRTAELSQANEVLKEQIAERERAEAALQEERNRLRTVIDNLPDLIYVKDTQSRFVLINRAVSYGFGVMRDTDIIDKTDFDFLPPQIARGFYDDEQGLFETGVPIINQETVDTDARGNKRWTLITKVPLRDNQDRIIGLVGINRDITQLKQAEEQLTQVVTSARCLLWYAIVEERAGKLVWSIHFADEEAAQRFIPLDIPPGRSYSEAWDPARMPEDRGRMDMTSTNAIRSGLISYSQEFRCRQANGEIRWLNEDVIIKPLMPKRWSLVGVCTDITDRKRAEETLQKANEELERRVQERTLELSKANEVLKQQIAERERAEAAERRQRLLAESLRDAAAELSATLDLDAVMKRILAQVARVVPHDAANIMLIEDGTARVVRHHGYNANIVNLRLDVRDYSDLQHMIDSSTPRVVFDTRTDENWKIIPEVAWIRSNVSAPIKSAGAVIGFVSLDSAQPNTFTLEQAWQLQAFANQAGIAIQNARFYDAIRHHASELERRVAERTSELERERAQLQTILDAMGDGVTGVVDSGDGQNYRRFTNPAMTQMTGYTPENWNENLFRGEGMSDEDYAALRQQIMDHIKEHGIWQGELKLHCADGRILDVGVTITRVGSTEGTVTIVRDISQEKALQEQKDRFIANAAHELRTPLANIVTRLYLIRKQPEKLDDHLPILESVTHRMRKLVEDLLDQSRFERGLIALAPAEVVLQKLIEDVVIVQSPEAAQKGISLRANLPEEPLIVCADMGRMTQVFTNLVINAINYTPEGGSIQIELHPEHTDEGHFAVVQVRDNGVGIAPDQVEHIFKPFFRANEATQGTGLGLSIAREIVTMHDGTIVVESCLGQGSCFMVHLPLATVRV